MSSQQSTAPSSPPSVLEAALEYARRGIPVFPCSTLDKKPMTAHGFKDATTDEVQIRTWWEARWPNAMIGAPTGAGSGMWVFDTDKDPSNGTDGEATLARLIARYGLLPKTLTSMTPRGGRHRFFIWPSNIEIRNSAGKLGPGIDTRGEGGYVILPPSRNANGAVYQWDKDEDASKAVYAPDWLVELIRSETRAQRRDKTWATAALETEYGKVARARAGTRNNTLNEAAFNLFQIVAGGFLDDREVRDRLLEAAKVCGLVDDDGALSVVRTIDSGARAGSAQPRTRPGGPALPPPPPPQQPGAGPHPAPQPAAPIRPMIRLEPGELLRNIDEAESALIAAGGCGLYQRGGLIVRPVVSKLKAADGRLTFGWHLIPVVKLFMVETMMRAADFEKWDGRARRCVPKDCPLPIAETYLARTGHWRLPVLLGVINVPFLRADGSPCEQPGYDAASQLLFEPNGRSFPTIPSCPKKDDAAEALKYLERVIRAFPFVQPVDRAVALSAILTVLDRPGMRTAPLHAFTAPSPRTGKSLLVDIASLLATGQLAPVIAQGGSEEELEKRLGAAMISADPIISVDNCDRELASSFLCQILTQTRFKVRFLGHSRHVEVLNNAAVFCTGNNLVVAADLASRTLLCALDAGCEYPETRRFDFDVLELIHSERERLVVAALTILRAWHVANEPRQLEPFGGFEDWSRRVREPLVWLGQADPCASLENVRKRDPYRVDHETVLKHWESSYLHTGAKRAHTVQEIIAAGLIDVGFRAALVAVAGNASGISVSNERLGRWLRKVEGKVVGGLRLARSGNHKGYPLWMLERA